MCGVNFILDKESSLDESFISKMNATTLYRGPDATSLKIFQQRNARVYIGTNRLKVIDLEDEANQPFVSADLRYTLSFNGEIYNYKELRKTLEGNFTFRTSSDTEVLLHLLISEGANGLEKLNGMFAFVFFDQQEGKVMIARDPSGIKPLYYYEDEKYFIASSEIKGILATGLVKKELNSEQIEHYLRFKFAAKPLTFYKGILELEEGRVLECSVQSDEYSVKSYTRKPNLIQSEVDDNKFFLRTEEILVEAVQRQLKADVPAGLFLSGGVDSTLLLAIIHELGIKGFPCFSVANSAQEKSFGTEDYHFSRLATKKYQSDLHQIEISSSILSQFDDLISRMDQPIADGASLLTFILSRYSSNHVKVMLSGAGADELFGGYNRHIAYYKYLKFRNRGLISIIQKFGKVLPAGFIHPYRKQFRLINKFASQIDQDPGKTFSNFCSSEYFNDDFFGIKSVGKKFKRKDDHDIDFYLSQALEHDRMQYLISDVLNMTDSMSMQNSLEVRVPYLDSALIAQTDKVKPSFLLKYGRKWMLQRMLTKRGGEEFCRREKEGFGMPLGKWLREKDGADLIGRLKIRNNILYNFISYEKVQGLVKDHQSSKNDLSSELWSLSVLAAWLEREFKS